MSVQICGWLSETCDIAIAFHIMPLGILIFHLLNCGFTLYFMIVVVFSFREWYVTVGDDVDISCSGCDWLCYNCLVVRHY